MSSINYTNLIMAGTIYGGILGTICALTNIKPNQFKVIMASTLIGTTIYCFMFSPSNKISKIA